MFSKATLVKYLHICWPLAVDITHNRERKAPNALIHWTAALLLLQRRKKGSLQQFSTASAALSPFVFFLSCFLFHLIFPSAIQAFTRYLFVQPLTLCRLLHVQIFSLSLQSLSFLFRCSHIFFAGLSSFFHQVSFSLNFLLLFLPPYVHQQVFFSICSSPQRLQSMCFCAQFPDCNLSMSL